MTPAGSDPDGSTLEYDSRADRLTVLVAEDDPINEFVAVVNLEQRGYRVRVAHDGRQAVEMLAQGPFACILMDCEMPEMDGYAATAEIRRLEVGGRRTPIIAMTAHSTKGERERCLNAGMDDHLSKPLGSAALDSMLQSWVLSKPEASSETNGSGGAPPVREITPNGAHPAGGPLDASLVARLLLRWGSAGELGGLVELFATQSHELLADMRTAIEARDAGSVRDNAHKLSGGCVTLAATRMADLCTELEMRATAGSVDGAAAVVDQIEAAFEQAHEALLALNPEVNGRSSDARADIR